MDAFSLAGESDRWIIVQEVLKAVPKDAEDSVRKRKILRHHQMRSANCVRQLASSEPVTAGSLALDKKRGRHLGEEGETFLRIGLEPAAFELEFDLGNQFAAPGRLYTSFIERSPRDAGVRRELMRDAAKSGAEPRFERRG